MNVYKINKIEDLLANNTYAGRGLIIGKSEDGEKAAAAYFIMGRSENSRNRIFKEENGNVTIYPYDVAKVKDPSLIIYSPVKSFENKLIVTNGNQTDTIYDYLKIGKTFEDALSVRDFEPDAPNYTPRISGLLDFEDGGFTYKMNILKSEDENGSACERFTFSYSPVNGLGHFIHTYVCDGNPVPSFYGEPERIYIPNDAATFADAIWNNLNSDNKISLYVRFINLKTGKKENILINKNK